MRHVFTAEDRRIAIPFHIRIFPGEEVCTGRRPSWLIAWDTFTIALDLIFGRRG